MKFTYQCYDSSYRYGYRYTTNDAEINISQHSQDVSFTLKNLAEQFKRCNIGDEPHKALKKATFSFYRSRDIARFSDSFSSAVDALCTPYLLNSEAEFIKSLPEYNRFISSSLIKDLSSELHQLFSKGRNTNPNWPFYVSEITGCSVPNLFDDNEDSFYLSLWAPALNPDCREISADLRLPRSKKYRRLSISETSMLAISLAELFPNFFTFTWVVYGTETTKKDFFGKTKYIKGVPQFISEFEFGLTPTKIVNKTATAPQKRNTPIDIY